jgi:hypothetical protein
MATGRVPTTANSPLTAKGDLFTYSTAPARLAVGNNGETIVADSSTSTGLKWAKSPNFVGCSVNNSYVVINNATETKVPFNSEAFDTNGFHDNATNNTRLTIPTGLGGKYLINVNCKFFKAAGGQRYVNILKNNTTSYQIITYLPSVDYYVSAAASFILDLSAGDYLEYVAYQNSGNAIELLARTPFEEPFSIQYLGA